MPALSRNNEDQDSKPQSLHRELGRGGGCYMIPHNPRNESTVQGKIMPENINDFSIGSLPFNGN
jgi:hypothetical protein